MFIIYSLASRSLIKLKKKLHFQFSQIESGRLEAHFCETNIAKFTRELAANFKSMAESLDLKFILDIPDDLGQQLKNPVFIDQDMYEKIVFNLCKS